MSNNAKFEIMEEKSTGYYLKIKLDNCSEAICVTLNRATTFDDQWNMKWNTRLSLYKIAILVQTIFEIKGSEIEYLVITLPAFQKKEQIISFKMDPDNKVNTYLETLTRLTPDTVLWG